MGALLKSKKGLHFQLEGPPHKPTLIFSNSLGTNLTMWQPQFEFFKNDFQILRYDTRGHGNSLFNEVSNNESGFELKDLAQDVLDLMAELKINKAHYCGISIGGFTGMYLGIHAPEFFHSITLANTAPKISTAEVWNQRIALVTKEGLAPVAQASATRWFTPRFVEKNPELVKKITEDLKNTQAPAYIHCCEVLRDTDLTPQISKINLPVLIIAGAADSVTTVAQAQEMKALIQNSEIAILPGSHLSNLEYSLDGSSLGEDFNKALAHFLAGLK